MNSDALIDIVARQMTEGDAPSDFRARVVAGLTVARPAGWLRAAMPAAAAAALVFAWLLGRAPGPRLPIDLPMPKQAFATAAASPLPNATAMSARSTVRSARSSDAVVSVPMSAEELAWWSRAVPPLPAADPLVLSAIQPSALSIAPITVDPIVSERIALTPIDSSPGGRD